VSHKLPFFQVLKNQRLEARAKDLEKQMEVLSIRLAASEGGQKDSSGTDQSEVEIKSLKVVLTILYALLSL